MSEGDQAGHLAQFVLNNLQYQQDWKDLKIHTHSTSDGSRLPQPLISGLPPRRLYLHPDDQIALLKTHNKADEPLPDVPEVEWVLATHITDKWTLRSFANVFDAMPASEKHSESRPKRLLLCIVHDDSTIVFYLMHDGIVKPRQN
ncbi:tRNA-splicing endonuclease subunit Sen15 [Microdochium trichocladiopsis]|uniref:tRNA-splicing endonuclease subunit Sen15 n=1 Tax=Microdochium trichocladiopsis TaxID=1682393 RepID=A0A9P9BV18_9PEZI|nr:tRNA-splicing endonuclease subunit Sen15 [Microdochium trichocladiopsis]KAH7038039.1 tRNA-splicing endonuclease subunit Sen15 [Microdochium trichocladiopsis]